MAEIKMYCTRFCPYCIMAVRLLEKKNQQIEKIYVDNEPELRAHMRTISNGRNTVPQIFINGQHVGGYSDMAMLEHRDELDSLLNA
ncbi:MAG TPA: glutaredoxin 3 [Gammaproteobacteria bacterium]|nr:glutaredoxin 3 [Gammaproteobacteria bacterium]